MDFNDVEFSRWDDCDEDCCANAGPVWSTERMPQRFDTLFTRHIKHPSNTLQLLARNSPKKVATLSQAEEHGTSESMISTLKLLAGSKSLSSLEKNAVGLSGNPTAKAIPPPTVAVATAEFEWPPSSEELLQKEHCLPTTTQPIHSYRHTNKKAPRRLKQRSLSIVSCREVPPSTDTGSQESDDTMRGPLPQLSRVQGVHDHKKLQESLNGDEQKDDKRGRPLNRQRRDPSYKAWIRPDANTDQRPLRMSSTLPKNATAAPIANKRTASSHLKVSDFKVLPSRRLSDATQALHSTTTTKRFDSKYALPVPT